jgi:hypothetical protein
MITTERVRELIMNIDFQSSNMEKGKKQPYPIITMEERRYVMDVWASLPSNTSFMTALYSIITNNEEARHL